jgi:hypothetical protein
MENINPLLSHHKWDQQNLHEKSNKYYDCSKKERMLL